MGSITVMISLALVNFRSSWEMVGVRYRRSLFPGYSDTVEYSVLCPSGAPRRASETLHDAREFAVPAGTRGTLHITATLRYRKIDQFLLNYVLGEKAGLTAPVADIASATARVPVASKGE